MVLITQYDCAKNVLMCNNPSIYIFIVWYNLCLEACLIFVPYWLSCIMTNMPYIVLYVIEFVLIDAWEYQNCFVPHYFKSYSRFIISP